NKELKEQRIKEYFVQATKELLKAEGIKSLTVRNISDRAGYSYATLYNYFKDINELIFLCVNDFYGECENFVANQTAGISEPKEKLTAKIKSYINYFVEYPDIFDLFFLTKVGDFGGKTETITIITHSLERICEQEWNYLVGEGLIMLNKAEELKKMLKLTVTGLLLFYLNRMSPKSYTDFIAQANEQINITINAFYA
ncbi:MAG: TetR/AcrR family transcriptional regulator, partial [Paludibacteraceae bacterium]|nr:TetR/AcrR family transcriptional regulator [Paludibacteraceae bacterium]